MAIKMRQSGLLFHYGCASDSVLSRALRIMQQPPTVGLLSKLCTEKKMYVDQSRDSHLFCFHHKYLTIRMHIYKTPVFK